MRLDSQSIQVECLLAGLRLELRGSKAKDVASLWDLVDDFE